MALIPPGSFQRVARVARGPPFAMTQRLLSIQFLIDS
jgi:hypothetical protein